MKLNIIYEDNNVLVIDKPAGISVFREGNITEKTLAECLLEQYPDFKKAGSPPRYGIAHRLDKDTSGVLLAAKNSEALFFLQKQFSPYGGSPEGRKNTLEKKLEKRYIALVVGNIKNDQGIIETLIGRSPKDGKKQKVFLSGEPGSMEKRQAITEYKTLERYPAQGGSASGGDAYTLLEVVPKTGRKHQIRCHLAYINHPIAGDKMYGFKNQPLPKGLNRHFLHASYLKIKMPDAKEKEFQSELPEDLRKVINNLKSEA